MGKDRYQFLLHIIMALADHDAIRRLSLSREWCLLAGVTLAWGEVVYGIYKRALVHYLQTRSLRDYLTTSVSPYSTPLVHNSDPVSVDLTSPNTFIYLDPN